MKDFSLQRKLFRMEDIGVNIIEQYYNQAKQDFNKNEKETIKHLLKLYRKIPAMTINELANQCYVSTSTLHRLIKKLGFRGYPDFKYQITDSLKEKIPERFDDDRYLMKTIKYIEITKQLNEKVIDKAEEIILQRKNRFCFGIGWNVFGK